MRDADQGASRLPSSRPVAGNLTVAIATAVTMVAFAANSLLTRMALRTTAIDPASFTAIRLGAGALTLLVIAWWKREKLPVSGSSWISATLLFVYAMGFSLAYRGLSTGAGALLVFAGAQITMLSYGYFKGERANPVGMLLACAGLVAFLLPSTSSTSAPPLGSVLVMAVAGVAWGGYSLLGRALDSPVAVTTSSFICASPLAAMLLLAEHRHLSIDCAGGIYALLSGAVTSALAYVLWYWVRVRVTVITAGAVQLFVPLIGAVMGVAFLRERMSLQSVVSALVALLGVAIVTLTVRRRPRS